MLNGTAIKACNYVHHKIFKVITKGKLTGHQLQQVEQC